MSDGALVRAALGGDTDAFRVLVERSRLDFGRYAVAMLGDADSAADAMQEALIRAWDSLDTCRDPDRFRSWFFRILANQCHTARGRRKPHVGMDDVELPARERADARLERGELALRLGAALDDLTPEQREAFVMKHVDGRTYEEMAALLGVGEDALKMRVHRARDALRGLLGDLR
jgi:RNA polymerase sigma-70 factor (ECF subfamily)